MQTMQGLAIQTMHSQRIAGEFDLRLACKTINEGIGNQLNSNCNTLPLLTDKPVMPETPSCSAGYPDQ